MPAPSALSRRRLLGLTAATGFAWGSRLAAGPAEASAPSGTRVHLDTDGVGLTVREFADLLQRLSAGVTPDEYSLGGEVEQLEAFFAGLLGKEQAVFLPSGTLANHLASHGSGLVAGQIVTTGSYCGVLDVPLDTPLAVALGDFARLSVRFTAT